MSFCSPTAINKSFCYSYDSLLKVASAWNYLKPNDKIVIDYNKIKEKICNYTKSNNDNYWAWVDIIRMLNNNKNYKITTHMKDVEKK